MSEGEGAIPRTVSGEDLDGFVFVEDAERARELGVSGESSTEKKESAPADGKGDEKSDEEPPEEINVDDLLRKAKEAKADAVVRNVTFEREGGMAFSCDLPLGLTMDSVKLDILRSDKAMKALQLDFMAKLRPSEFVQQLQLKYDDAVLADDVWVKETSLTSGSKITVEVAPPKSSPVMFMLAFLVVLVAMRVAGWVTAE